MKNYKLNDKFEVKENIWSDTDEAVWSNEMEGNIFLPKGEILTVSEIEDEMDDEGFILYWMKDEDGKLHGFDNIEVEKYLIPLQ